MELDRNGLEVLEREDCMRLLETQTIGRIALTIDALPTVLPVGFRVVDGEVVLRTSPGGKLRAATDQAVVAFEVDHYDALDHGGWSVVVTGVARRITDPSQLERIHPETIPRWAGGRGDDVVAISTELVSGRRITRSVPAAP